MASPPSLYRSLIIQSRVIGALFLREVLTRYGRHNIGFLWLFVEPMLFTLGVTALWTFTRSTHGLHLPITAFAVTGYSSVLLWRGMPNRCITAVEPNLSLMYHQNVKVIDLFASRILLEIAGVTTSFVSLTLIFHAMNWMALPEDPLKVVLAWFMIVCFGAALGLFLGTLSVRNEIVDKIWHPISYLLFPLSGAIFMVEWLPPTVQKLVLFLPMVHGVELLREGYFGSMIHAHYDLAYMAMFTLVLILLGLAKERALSRQVLTE